MTDKIHPYVRYGQALVILENDISITSEIPAKFIAEEIEVGLSSFRVQPVELFEAKEKVKYSFARIEKGKTDKGIFLSPNVISTDMLGKNTWKAAIQIIDKCSNNLLDKSENVTMAISPLTGEYLSFSTKGGIGRGKPKSTVLDMGLSMITTLTPYKPCLQNRGDNSCIIPDLPLKEMMDFISLFKDMLNHQTSKNIYYGRVKKEEKGKEPNVKITYKPIRPLLFQGNFPNPPKSTSLGTIVLLATIGEFCKKTDYSQKAKKVIESLKNTTLYLIKYGDAKTFSYNHFVIDLAKNGNLRRIVDSLYYSKLYNQSHRDYNNTEYQKFDLFTSRFLQLFNQSSFKDFLAFRAEYPNEIELLLKTYFEKMEKIDSKLVSSAKHLGRWLNLVAYHTAKHEVKEGTPNYWEKLREQKAKVLVELESSTFSAKTGDAMVAQVVTRAGRLSGMDAPNKAELFMEKTSSGELPLEQAKNLLIAFSRLRNAKEDTEKKETEGSNETESADIENNNYQNS